MVLTSADLLTWCRHGGALQRVDPALGTDYGAPEVADADGRCYRRFARDVLDTARPEALRRYADWQIYERDREMHGARYDWHTLEGPSVVRRHGRC